MFRKRDSQSSLFGTSNLMPAAKQQRVAKTWAAPFRERALPLIEEDVFARLYCADNGRPNRPVQTVFGVLLLKEMFGLTDAEALEQLEFNVLWHHALDLTLEEAHLPQKTLHNFRARLMADDQGRLAFETTTGRILAALGTDVSRQRLDSTHVMSNMAVRTRLGLFCETMRVFLKDLEKQHPQLTAAVPVRLWRRYVKGDGTASGYQDARSSAGRRRLEVCARDLYRLCTEFADTPAAALASYGLLQRLLEEQCAVGVSPQEPHDDADDAGEGGVPVILKAKHNVTGSSLQSPHDPDATYSGHKGKGYSVQVSETCGPDNETQIITHVSVTDACVSDAQATMPVLGDLDERDMRPDELVADTLYGSAENAMAAEAMRTELVSPVGGSTAPEDTATKLSAADFEMDAEGTGRCPAGHAADTQQVPNARSQRVLLGFVQATCAACPLRSYCPVTWHAPTQTYTVRIYPRASHLARRRRAQTGATFRERYAIRAGIEATNSELKRGHGLGHLRVRGRPRVVLATYLKALSCNIKRMVMATLRAAEAPTPAMA